MYEKCLVQKVVQTITSDTATPASQSELNVALGYMTKGTDIFPFVMHAKVEGGIPTATLACDAVVSRREDGGLILTVRHKIDFMQPVLLFDGKGAKVTMPGFTVVGL